MNSYQMSHIQIDQYGPFIVNMLLPIITKKIKTREEFLALWEDGDMRWSHTSVWGFVNNAIKSIVGELDYDLVSRVQYFVKYTIKAHYEFEYAFSDEVLLKYKHVKRS